MAPNPDWIRRCLVADLFDLDVPYMVRTSDDSDSPWMLVKTASLGFWTDRTSGARMDYLTIQFHDDAAERVINPEEEIEIGMIGPPP